MSEIVRHCSMCGKPVPLDANGCYRRHLQTLGGQRRACPNSGLNALTATELGWPRSAYRIR